MPAGAQRGDQGGDFLAGDQFVKAGAFDVEDFALQRQDGLKFTVAALLWPSRRQKSPSTR